MDETLFGQCYWPGDNPPHVLTIPVGGPQINVLNSSTAIYSFQAERGGEANGSEGTDYAYYTVLHRPENTTIWNLDEVGWELSTDPTWIVGLPVCVKSELRAQCPYGDFSVSEANMLYYLDHPSEPDGNISTNWFVTPKPGSTQVCAKSLKLSAPDPNSGTIELSWETPITFSSTNHKIEIFSSSNPTWVEVGNTNENSFDLTNLQLCSTYQVRVRSSIICDSQTFPLQGTSLFWANQNKIEFVFSTDITQIDNLSKITGSSVFLEYSTLSGNNQPPYNILWQKTTTPNSWNSQPTPTQNFTLAGLEKNTNYNVKAVRLSNTVCPDGVARNFKTNMCDENEPNNNVSVSTPIDFGVWYDGKAAYDYPGNHGIIGTGDVDWYSFVPTCAAVKVLVNNPDCNFSDDFNEYVDGTDFDFKIYDQGLNVVEQAFGDPDEHVYSFIPGETYYLAISDMFCSVQPYPFTGGICYNFGVFNGDVQLSNEIKTYHPNDPTQPPYLYFYLERPVESALVSWEIISGEAIIDGGILYPICHSCVTLQATITDCNGNSTSYTTNINCGPEMNGCEGENELLTFSPNPTNGFVNVQITNLQLFQAFGTNTRVELSNANGSLISDVKFPQIGTMSFDLSASPNGLYFLRLYSEKNSVKFQVLKN